MELEEGVRIERNKRISLIFMIIIGVLCALCFYLAINLTSIFAANIALFDAHDASVFAVMLTIPLFLIFVFFQLMASIPAFVLSIINLCKFKYLKPLAIIFIVVTSLFLLYPFVLITILSSWNSGGSTTSSVSETVSQIMYLL